MKMFTKNPMQTKCTFKYIIGYCVSLLFAPSNELQNEKILTHVSKNGHNVILFTEVSNLKEKLDIFSMYTQQEQRTCVT